MTAGSLLPMLLLRSRLMLMLARLAATPAPPMTSPGAQPFYFQGRNGAAVLLVHGFSSTPREMRELGESLSGRGYTVSGMLLPGHGTTPEDLRHRTAEEWYAKVREEYRALRSTHGRVYVVGFSLGGLLALRLAEREDVAGTVALAPALGITYRWFYVLTPEAHARTIGRLLPYVRKSPRWAKVSDRSQIPGHVAYTRIPTAAVRELLRLSEEVRASAAELRGPLLIVQSRHDRVSSPRATGRFFESLKTADKRLVWLERSDHLITLDYEKRQVFDEASRFLDGLEAYRACEGEAALAGRPAAQAKGDRDPAAVLQRIDGLVKEDVEAWCRESGLSYPPDAVVLRVFKKERELEIWAKNADQKRMRLVRVLPVCAMDFAPGPKLTEGDGKTPEGFYHPDFGYKSSNWFMWMDLDPRRVAEPGEVGKGSSFKMCIDYPNALDRKRTRQAGFGRKTGGDICVHGNCVSIGCASFKNKDFLPVFAFARHHDPKRFGDLQLHVFPFRFDKVSPEDREQAAKDWLHSKALGREELLRFWGNLQQGYEAFNADPDPLRVRLGKAGYEYK